MAAFKFDMAKAYEHLEWRFLLTTMESFGFLPQARDLIYWNICNIWYSFRINGEYHGSFKTYGGVRKGDPLSPLLYVLAQQVLLSNLKQLSSQAVIKPYQIRRNEKSIDHLFYANDVLVFTNGSGRSLTNLMKLIRGYQASSRQQVNLHKSAFLWEAKPYTMHKLFLLLQELVKGAFRSRIWVYRFLMAR